MSEHSEEEKLTPEERLFKIIQDQEKSESQPETLFVPFGKKLDKEPDAQESSEPEPEGKEADLQIPVELSTSEPLKKLATPLDDLRAGVQAKNLTAVARFFSLSLLNRLLGAGLAVLCVYFLVDAVYLKENKAEIFITKVNQVASLPEQGFPEDVLSFEPPPDLEAATKRNAFRSWKPPEVIREEKAPEQPKLNQGVTGLKLSGIYLDENPEALIEVLDEKKTYAVKLGSQIKGLTIKEIQPKCVILTNGQENYTLQ